MGEKKCVRDFGAENYGKKKPFGRPSVDGIIISNGHKRNRTRRSGLDERDWEKW
jgi:hypothetical protein